MDYLILQAEETFEAFYDATIQRTSTAYEKFSNGLVNIDNVCSFRIKENVYSDAVEILRKNMFLSICKYLTES